MKLPDALLHLPFSDMYACLQPGSSQSSGGAYQSSGPPGQHQTNGRQPANGLDSLRSDPVELASALPLPRPVGPVRRLSSARSSGRSPTAEAGPPAMGASPRGSFWEANGVEEAADEELQYGSSPPGATAWDPSPFWQLAQRCLMQPLRGISTADHMPLGQPMLDGMPAAWQQHSGACCSPCLASSGSWLIVEAISRHLKRWPCCCFTGLAFL